MNFEHGGNIFEISKKFNLNLNDILDFSVNINPIGFPDVLKTIILENINFMKFYPEIYSSTLKKKIASKLDCLPENIVVGNGSIQLIYAINKALNFKNIVIVEPTFSEYRKALSDRDVKIYNFKLNESDNFILKIDYLINFLEKVNFDAVFLCNPNNPNGFVLDGNEVEKLISFMENIKKYLIIDEAFIDFTDQRGVEFKNFNFTIVLKSFTKIFAIPGMRLGYLKADRLICEKIEQFIEPWSVNIFSQIIGEKLVNLDDFIENTKKFLDKEREFVVKELSKIEVLKIFPSNTNFLLIKILTSKNVSQLEEYLFKNKVLIRNCSNYIGLNNKFFRISINRREDNLILIQLLKNFFIKRKV